MILSIFIINKSGGLMYYEAFQGSNKLDANDALIFAGTFHGVHAIAAKLSPVESSSGLQLVETDAFKLYCMQSMTGLKFIAVTDVLRPNMDMFLRKVYQIYADYALKNPYYSLEMPVRSELFDAQLSKLVNTA